MKAIHLQHCTVEYHDWGARTVFRDGTHVDAVPHPGMAHYSVIAHRTGYGDDLLAYTREHEICHSIVQEFFNDQPSYVLWGLAHGRKNARWETTCEEALAQMLQRFIRAGEQPIISGVDWHGLKQRALGYLDGRA